MWWFTSVMEEQKCSRSAPFYLWAADVEEGMEAEEGNFTPSQVRRRPWGRKLFEV